MGQKTKSPAKVTRPLLTRYHPRKRVFDLLDKLLEVPVVWVSGPAGCGKTTLINSYLTERKLRPLWYQVDEGDVDPATFFYYMKEAAKAIARQKGRALPLLAPEYQQSLPHFTMRYFEQLFGLLPAKSVIVLDDYQDVPETAVFHTLIRQGLSQIPEDMRVILIGRTEPPPELARLEVNRQMTTISWNDLRLSPEETAGIVEVLSSGVLPDDSKMQDIHHLSDGWVAGVVLMVRKAVTEGVEPQVFFKQSPDVIFDYFASEVFAEMDGVTKEFLLKTAYLPNMSKELAQELTGNPDAESVLAKLARHNYFIERRFQADAIYSYHPLFRQFLLKRAKAELSSETIIKVITEAACLLEREGHVDDALTLIREAGDWDTMTRFLMEHGKSMLEHGRYRSLEKRLAEIPDDVIGRFPWLQFWLGLSCMPFDPLKSMSHLESAYNSFKEQNDVYGVFQAWSGMAYLIAYGFSDWAKVDGLIRDLEERRDTFDSLQSDEVRALVASGMFGIMALRYTQHPDADFWADLALDLNHKIGDTAGIIRILLARTRYRLATGNVKQVGEVIEYLHRLSREQDISELLQLNIKVCEALYYDLAIMHEQCLEVADTGLDLARISDIHVWDALLLCHAAMSSMNVGDHERAAHYIGLLSQYDHETRSWVQSSIFCAKARYAFLIGNLKEAELHAEQGLRLYPQIVTPFWSCCHLIFYARIMLHLGKRRSAEDLLSRSEKIAHNLSSPLVHSYIKYLDAEMAFDSGQDETGLSLLREILPMARDGGFWTVWEIPASTVALCTRALEAGIEVDYVKEIIRKRRLIPDELSVTPDSWPWPVKVYTLGKFLIMKEEEPLQFSKKAQKKPLEMLKALITLGGSQVSEARIADLLWPDADGDLAIQSCVTTLHRLRKMLGHHDVVLRQNNQLTMNRSYFWVDAWAFEHLMDQAEALWEKAETEEQFGKAGEFIWSALDLYRGEFLPEDAWNPDAVSLRESLLNRYFEGLYKLTDRMMRSSQWEEARRLFERGLTIDDSAEACYQGLMVCLQKIGRKAEAVAVYERCKRTLEVKFQVKPSPDTEALARKIKLDPGI
jgi:LuxR family transcriptional regulator, maltose regulon positive regulatory protein